MKRRTILTTLILSSALAAGCDEEDSPQPTPTARTVVKTRAAKPAPRRDWVQSADAADAALAALVKTDEAFTKTEEARSPRRPGTSTLPAAAPRGSATSVVLARRAGAAHQVEQRGAMTATNDDGMQLTASIVAEADALVITLRVVNGAKRDAYVFTPLTRYDFAAQAWGPAPERVYSRLRSDGVLDLTKRVVPLPQDREVFQPEVPYLTRLEPGAALLETVRVPLPLELDRPYHPAKGAPSEHVAKGVAFSIGYAVEVPAGALRPADGGRFKLPYGLAKRAQQILRSGVQPLRVRVRSKG